MADTELLVNDQGEEFDVPGQDVGRAMAAGLRKPSTTVEMFDDAGDVYDVPETDIARAQSAGLKTGQDVKYGDQEGRTFQEGLARGATLGLSDVVQAEGAGIGTRLGNWAADKMGIGLTERATGRGLNAGVEAFDRTDQADKAVTEAKADILGRKEANRKSAIAGELGGMLATSAATGGLGSQALAARVFGQEAAKQAARSAIASVARKGAELALTGAAEGAVYGAAKELNDAYTSGDYEQLAEKTLGGAYEGAKIGAILSPVIGGAMSVLGAGARRFLGRGASVGDDLIESAAKQGDDIAIDSAETLSQRVKLDTAIEQQTDELSRLSQVVGNDVSAQLETAMEPIYMQRGALISRDIAEAEVAKAQKLFKRARDAAGGFDEARDKAVENIGDLYTKVLQTSARARKFASKAAKRQAARLDETGVPGSQLSDDTLGSLQTIRDRVAAMIDEVGGVENAKAAYDNGGYGALMKLVKRVDMAEEQAAKFMSMGQPGQAAMQLDDLKTAMGSIHGKTRNPIVKALIEGTDEAGETGLYRVLQKELENIDQWGDFAVTQRKVNPLWSEEIRRANDQRLSRFVVSRSGEAGANGWEAGSVANKEGLHPFLGELGETKLQDVERAFRMHLRSSEASIRARAKAWGSKELQKEANELSGYIDEIESTMNAVALSRSNKKAWEKATSDIGDIPFIGSTVKTTLNIGSKVAGKVSSETARRTGTRVSTGVTSAAESTRKSAIRVHQRASSAPSRFVAFVKDPKTVSAAETAGIKLRVDQVLSEARGLQNPISAEYKRTQEYLGQIAEEDPDVAQAMAMKIQQRSQFILEKAQQFPGDQLRMRRYAVAVADPAGSLSRIASGRSTDEDVETLKAVYPSMWSEFVSNTVAELDASDANYAARVRASLALGMPLDDSMSPDSMAFTQARMGASSAAAAASKDVDMSAQTAPLTGDRVAFDR